MNKQTRIWLFVGAAAIAVYFLYRYIQNRGGTESGSGALGTNLNSVAPELIGGSSGPSQGPAVDVPVVINVTEQSSLNGDNDPTRYIPANNQTAPAAQLAGMNAGVGRAENPATSMPSPVSQGNAAAYGNAMKSGTSRTKSPMTAHHRAAAHPDVTSQAQSNLARSAQGATRPSVPSPSSHAAHHGSGAKSGTKRTRKAK